jgi:hypothetical protein
LKQVEPKRFHRESHVRRGNVEVVARKERRDVDSIVDSRGSNESMLGY